MKGFEYEGKQIYFLDGQGKDISFERWRVNLYYSDYQAKTIFLNSQAEYDKFMQEHQPLCYSDYATFKKQFRGEPAYYSPKYSQWAREQEAIK
jgi:hypothetical protein